MSNAANYMGTGLALIYLADPSTGLLEPSLHLGPGMHPVADWCALSDYYSSTVEHEAEWVENPLFPGTSHTVPRVPGWESVDNAAEGAERINAWGLELAAKITEKELILPTIKDVLALNYAPPYSENWREEIPF